MVQLVQELNFLEHVGPVRSVFVHLEYHDFAARFVSYLKRNESLSSHLLHSLKYALKYILVADGSEDKKGIFFSRPLFYFTFFIASQNEKKVTNDGLFLKGNKLTELLIKHINDYFMPLCLF